MCELNSLEKAFAIYSNIYNYTHVVSSSGVCDYFLERAYESQKYVITMVVQNVDAGSAIEAGTFMPTPPDYLVVSWIQTESHALMHESPNLPDKAIKTHRIHFSGIGWTIFCSLVEMF